MAKMFKFEDKKGLELDINGVVFNVDSTDASFLKELKTFGQSLKNIGKDLKEVGEIKDIDDIDLDLLAKNNETVMNILADGIDALLGANSVERIFGERQINLSDLVQVSTFIISEVNNNVSDANLSKYAPKRKGK